LGIKFNEEKASSLHAGMVVMQLGRYRQQIAQHLAERLNPERTLRALLFLAALYHDAAKPETRSVEASGRVRFFNHEEIGAKLAINRGQALRLSNDEIERMAAIVANHMRPMLLALSEDQPTPRAIYRFFRVTDKAGLDVCLLSLADTWATYGETLPQNIWNGHLDVARALMGAWWERPEQQVSPPALLNGNEIMHHFRLMPGPLIGELLESIREAQAMGLVSTKEDAFGLVRKQLAERKPG
jgi:putative nucleotidyltransferase with HDIG domain